jgi:hypothetical protein
MCKKSTKTEKAKIREILGPHLLQSTFASVSNSSNGISRFFKLCLAFTADRFFLEGLVKLLDFIKKIYLHIYIYTQLTGQTGSNAFRFKFVNMILDCVCPLCPGLMDFRA